MKKEDKIDPYNKKHGANGRRGVPEQMLWGWVISLAIADSLGRSGANKEAAMHFLYKRRKWFNDVCDMAGLEPEYVLRIAKQAQSATDKARLLNEISKNTGKSKRVISDAFRANSGRKRHLRIVADNK